jgi:hypothetical protein
MKKSVRLTEIPKLGRIFLYVVSESIRLSMIRFPILVVAGWINTDQQHGT